MAFRLLFDPDSTHVEDPLGRAASDESIWTHAAEMDYLIVTKDEDFQRLSVLRGAPPKVVWVRPGNRSTSQVADLLRRSRDQLVLFVEHEEATFLALG